MMTTSQLLQQLGVIAFLTSSLGAARSPPLAHDVALAAGLGESGEKARPVEEGGNIGRKLYASGAGRSRPGWTVGTEEEASGMRVLFKVRDMSGLFAHDISTARLGCVTG